MPYKISGDIGANARILVFDETSGTLETSEDVTTGSYEIKDLTAGNKTVVARDVNGEALGYSQVSPVSYNPTIGRLSNGTDDLNWTITGFNWSYGAWWFTEDAETGYGQSEPFVITDNTTHYRYAKRANRNASAIVQLRRASDDVALVSENSNWTNNDLHTMIYDVTAHRGVEVYIYFENYKTGSYAQMGVSWFGLWDSVYTQIQSPFSA